MKLSNETVTVLKNFSTINQNLVINPGNKISTMSAMKNIVAKATVTEEFPQTFAIYDLNEFLSALSLFENPDLNFKDDFVVMTETGSKGKSLKYWYSDPSVVTALPDKEITMPSSEVSFTFSNNLLSDVTKAAAVIGAPDMCLEAMSLDKAVLKVTDKKNDTANDYAVGVDVTNSDGKDVSYKFWFKVENLRLLPGSYDVNVSSKRISYFKNTSVDVEYFIALEPESKYDA
jgi:methionine-rich copper-binding protein CopC